MAEKKKTAAKKPLPPPKNVKRNTKGKLAGRFMGTPGNLAYPTPELLEKHIDAYFEACAGEPVFRPDGSIVLDKHGKPIMINTHPYTRGGLCLALGFSNDDALDDYAKRPGYEDVVQRAKLRIKTYAQERLYDRDGCRGAEFTLRYGFGYKDKDVSTEVKDGGGVVFIPAVIGTEAPKDEKKDEEA